MNIWVEKIPLSFYTKVLNKKITNKNELGKEKERERERTKEINWQKRKKYRNGTEREERESNAHLSLFFMFSN